MIKSKERFGLIKVGKRFKYYGKLYKRYQGCWAVRVDVIGHGHVGIFFNPKTLVEPK